MDKIRYLDNQTIKNMFNDAPEYKKTALTGLRKLPWRTYVKSGDSYRLESTPFLPGVVIARNPGVIGYDENNNAVYNEWPIKIDVAIENYGQDVIDNLDENISWHQKLQTIRAIELTQEILNILGVKGNELKIKVSWSKDPMIAVLGDYLTAQGYSVSKVDMEKTYQKINKPNIKM